MAILGYSERGVFNSIVYYLEQNPDLIYPFLQVFDVNVNRSINNFTFLVDHSFEDFGICDLVILGEGSGQKIVIFIDSKTKKDGESYTVKNQYTKLKDAVAKGGRLPEVFLTNILFKVYCKHMLLNYVRKGSYNISKNRTIVKSCELIKDASDYCFIAILPQKITSDEFKDYFASIGKINGRFQEFYQKEKENITTGFWGDIYKFFVEKSVHAITSIFEYNEGLIYDEPFPSPQSALLPEPWYGNMVFLKSKKNKKFYHLTCDKEGTFCIRGPVDQCWEIEEEATQDIERYCNVFRRYRFVAPAGELNLSWPKNVEDFLKISKSFK